MYKVHVNEIIKLRKKTGFGIINCKKALMEVEGNFEKAIEFLRKTSKNKTYNSSDHHTTQGILISKVNSNNKKGIIIGLNCETDFVAKNNLFIKLANEIAEVALNCNDKNDILSSYIRDRDISIKETLFEHMAVIGEKLTLNNFEKLESNFVSTYVHHGNKIAALVGLSSYHNGVHIIGKELAMQVVAMNPIALNEEEIPYNIIEKEKEILKEQERNFYKTEDLLEKIVKGKLKKFICDNTLMDQNYIKNKKITVQNYLKKFNNNIYITGYKRISL